MLYWHLHFQVVYTILTSLKIVPSETEISQLYLMIQLDGIPPISGLVVYISYHVTEPVRCTESPKNP